MIYGELTTIRPVQPVDGPAILRWENNPAFWSLTAFPGPFQLNDILDFIRNSRNLKEDGQVRWTICAKDSLHLLGALDLFVSPKGSNILGIGILIGDETERGKGYASDALRATLDYLASTMEIVQVECLIFPDNIPSIRLFERQGFKKEGVESFNNRTALRYRKNLSRIS